MENYRPLYRIAVEHDYFNRQPCPALQCRLAPQGIRLAGQRRLLFRRTAANRWTVLYDSIGSGPDTANDTLELEISITDPAFPLYTEWKDFRPSAACVLELPRATEAADAASVFLPSDEKRKPGTPFCTVRLRLTEELLDAAKADCPQQAFLHFLAPSVQWEYLFLSRGRDYISLDDCLTLEDTAGKVEFLPLEPCEAYGRPARRTLSKGRIPMRADYESRLRLVLENGSARQKRILPVRICPPLPGRYESGRDGVIRQVCYY